MTESIIKKNANFSNKASTPVTIDSTYTTSNPYICPYDGYVRVTTLGESISILRDNGMVFGLVDGIGNDIISTAFIRKGSKIVHGGTGNSGRYCPLIGVW